VRVLVYAQLKDILGNEPLEMHLKQNPGVARAFGIEDGIPDRTTIGRWRERLGSVAREAFEKLSGIVAMLVPTELLVVDSTQLEDWGDPEAGRGFFRGPFKGFKVHVSVDQLGLPRKAIVTPGNRHDSPFLPELIAEQKPKYVLGDAGYDSENNRKACRDIGAKPCIATNPRRSGKRRYTPSLQAQAIHCQAV